MGGRTALARSEVALGRKIQAATVDRESSATHHEVVGILSNDDHLRKALVECMRGAGVSTALARTVLPEILAMCEEAYASVRDPITGLTIPIKPPSLRYVDRPRQMSVGEYAKMQWADYIAAELLFFEDIYRVAPDFHRACRFHAEQAGQTVHDYVHIIGILSRPVMVQNVDRYNRQLSLLKALEQMNQAKTRLKSVQDLLEFGEGSR